MRIDLGPEGRSGVEAHVYDTMEALLVYFVATDHKDDVWHHVLPGARRRELRAAREAVHYIHAHVGSRKLRLAGHSWGGCIASIVATILRREGFAVSLHTWGAKRAPRGYMAHGVHVRHRGDIVPLTPPWRPAYVHRVVGTWGLPLAEAHGSAYNPYITAWRNLR